MAKKKQTQIQAKKSQLQADKGQLQARLRRSATVAGGTRHQKPASRTARAVPTKPTTTIRILFTCVGRRIELLNAFRRAAERLKIRLEVHGADATAMSPGFHRVDKAHLVPTIASGKYIDALLDLVKRRKIELLIPLIDTELSDLAEAADRFAGVGCNAVVSSPNVIATCADKLETFRTLGAAGIDTPQTWTWEQAMGRKEHSFPYFLKPRRGSAAQGNHVIRTVEELRTFGQLVREPIVQEFVEGIEHTLDVYTGLDGVPRCVVPRRRIEVRTGEVSKSLIVKDASVMAVGRRVAEVLGTPSPRQPNTAGGDSPLESGFAGGGSPPEPGNAGRCRGVITVQCMKTATGRVRVIEINPRFGGGVPLSIHAGADFPRWIIEEHLGRRPRINPTGFHNDVAMLRYDESVFVPRASRLLDQKGKNSKSRAGRD